MIENIYTICNNIIPIIEVWKGDNNKQKRPVIIFMGRQHPAEIVGSYIMEELMNIFVVEYKKEEYIKVLL